MTTVEQYIFLYLNFAIFLCTKLAAFKFGVFYS